MRLVPKGTVAASTAPQVARLSRQLAVLGAPVAESIPTRYGEDTVDIDDGIGSYTATAFTFAPGPSPEISELSETEVASWAGAVAHLHLAGYGLSAASMPPEWLTSELIPAATVLSSTILAQVAAKTVEAVASLPRSGDVYGLVHGDPETDNLRWQGAAPLMIDLDDAARSWFMSDVCFALRDLAPRTAVPDRQHPVVTAFLRGYREVRALTDHEVSWWPLLARAQAVVAVARLHPAVTEAVDGDWPTWAKTLHARLCEIADQYVTALNLPIPR